MQYKMLVSRDQSIDNII